MTRGIRGGAVLCAIILMSACAKTGGPDRDAADVSGDPAGEPDADAAVEPPADVPAETSDPAEEVAEEVVEDPPADPADDPVVEAADTPADPVPDPWADIAVDPGGDAPADPAPDACTLITCAVEPPTDCTTYPMGCCSGDRHTIYCIGGTTIYSGCGSGLCGPDPTRFCYMNCI